MPELKRTSGPLEFRGVQALRALAACMVVVYHATEIWSEHVSAAGTWFNGALGVDIFFVISGFVMAISTRGKGTGPHPARIFMERRLVRIVPLYWLITAIVWIKISAVHFFPALRNEGPHSQLTLGWLLSSLLFIPYRNMPDYVQPVLLVGWTLSFEMFFYLLYASAIALEISEVLFLSPIMIGLAALGLWHGSFYPAIGVLASPLLLEFLAGVFIARAIEAGYRLKPGIAAVMAAVGLVGILTAPANNLARAYWISREAFAILLVLGVILLEPHIAKQVPRWLLAIGDASYSLYLVHFVFYSFLLKAIIRTGLLTLGATHLRGEILTVLLFAIPAILVSLGVYRWVEAPINNHLRRRLKLRNAHMQPITP